MSPDPVFSVKSGVKNHLEDPVIPEPTGLGEIQKESRRACGCMRTSEKLRNILKTFPQPPPPSPVLACKNCKEFIQINSMGVITPNRLSSATRKTYIAGMPALFLRDFTDTRVQHNNSFKQPKTVESTLKVECCDHKPVWTILKEVVSLIQLSVTATALVVYYLIYCYMQLIYFTLRSAVYFHQADISMKITITIATVTGFIISFYCLMRIEHLVGFHLRDILHYV